MGPRTFIAVSPQSFNPCNIHGISCRSLPVDPAERPTTLTPRGAGIVLIQRSATLTPPRHRLGTGSSFVAFVCIHNARQSVTAIEAWHLSSVGTTPYSRNSGGPRCSYLQGSLQCMTWAHSRIRADVRAPGDLVQVSQQKACKCSQAKLSLHRL